MFAIMVFGIDLNSPYYRFFDIKLYQESYRPVFNMINLTEIPLVPCSEAHFDFNEEVLGAARPLNISYALCPPLGHTF